MPQLRVASTLAASSLLLLLLCVLARPSYGARLPTEYRPTLHPPADVLFVVPDRSLSHLLTPAQWKGIEGALDAAKRHPRTRIGIVQYGKDGTRGVVQAMTFDKETARASFRSSLVRAGVPGGSDGSGGENQWGRKRSTPEDPTSLLAHQVYMDSAGIVEVLFGTLASFTSSSSKDDAMSVPSKTHLGLRPEVPWHVFVAAVANGRRRVTLSSEREWEVTQRFFDAVRPRLRQLIIEVFVHEECLDNADQACRHVIGDPAHESSYSGRVGGFNPAMTLSRALQATPLSYNAASSISTSPTVGGGAPPAAGGISVAGIVADKLSTSLASEKVAGAEDASKWSGEANENARGNPTQAGRGGGASEPSYDSRDSSHKPASSANYRPEQDAVEMGDEDDTSLASVHSREARAVSLQSRLLIAGGNVRVYPLSSLANNDELIASIATLVGPPPLCNHCADSSTRTACAAAKFADADGKLMSQTCLPSHGCVPIDHTISVFDSLPHHQSWDQMAMSPLPRKGADRRKDQAERMGRKSGAAGKSAARTARDAASRRGSSSGSSRNPDQENKKSSSDQTIDEWLDSGFYLETGVPTRVMTPKSTGTLGFSRRRHSRVRELRTWPGSQDFLARLIRVQQGLETIDPDDPSAALDFAASADSLKGMGVEPVLVRGGCASTWPALVHWRNLGGHFLQKLGQGGSGRGDSIPKSGEALLVEARVRERSLSRGNSDEGASANTSASARRAHRRAVLEEADFYAGEWDHSQMGLAGLAPTRAGDYETLRLNATSKDGLFILQDLLMHADMPRAKVKGGPGKKEESAPPTATENRATVLATDFTVRVPMWSGIRDDMYPDASMFVSAEESLTAAGSKDQHVWASTPGTATHTTFDRDHLVFAQVRGRRRFTLWGARAELDLNVYPRIHPMRDHSRWTKGRQLDYRTTKFAGVPEPFGEPADEARVPEGVPSWQIDLNPGEMLYVPPFTFYRAQVLIPEAASRAAAKDAGTAAAADAQRSTGGGGSAEAAGRQAEAAALKMNARTGSDHGASALGDGDGNSISPPARSNSRNPSSVAVTIIARSPERVGLRSHIEAALEIELCADTLATMSGRIFALRLHLDMLSNRIVGFESVAGVGYKILTSRYTGLEQSFPPLYGKCDASHHIETTARFGARTQSLPKGIPAEPRMGRDIRREASLVAKHFVTLDKAAKGGFRAARDILFRDYVELVVARVLGPERVLWFLRECLVRGGTEYFQASGRHSIIAKTAEERRRKEGHDSVRMWDKLWAGWKPALPMEPNAIQLRGPDKKEARGVSSEAGGKAREPLAPEAGVQGGGGRGAREEAGEKKVEEGSTVPVSDTEAVDRDVLTMAAEAARQELHPEPPSTALYGKQTWDLPSAATGKGEKEKKKKKKKKKDEL